MFSTHLFAPAVAQPSLMQARVGTEKVEGDGELKKRVTHCLQSLQVDEVTGIGHRQSVQNRRNRRTYVRQMSARCETSKISVPSLEDKRSTNHIGISI